MELSYLSVVQLYDLSYFVGFNGFGFGGLVGLGLLVCQRVNQKGFGR